MNKDNSVYINAVYEKTDVGSSKFFGAPDLPDGFDWPVDEEDYDMDFICQINCRDVHEFNTALPESGMMYFFGCIANPLGMKEAPAVAPGFQSMGNFCVKYEDIPESDLQSGEIVDENGDPVGFSELKINFSADENICTEAFHKMMGDHPDTDTDEDLSEYELLFCLDSFSGDDFTLEFEDCGYLYFLIKKGDLAKKDFSNVICFMAV